MTKHHKHDFHSLGKSVIQIELNEIKSLLERLDKNFEIACNYILNCKGRVVTIGMGKSGHIARKIAATFSSTGTPAFYMHPGEASHGDFGMITKSDVALALSNSGTTQEIVTLLPLIKQLNTPLITLTGNPNSLLAQEASVNLDVSVKKEACPLNLAPTASTTVALVMGDALAISLLKAKGFTEKDFAFSHPGGKLGRRLLLQIKDIMHTGEAIPKVKETALLCKALVEMTDKKLGMTAVLDKKDHLVGIFTDGDLRRVLDKHINIHQTKISEVMTKNCMTIPPNILAAEVIPLMETYKISGLLVVDEKNQVVGAFNFHDLWQAGVI